MQTGLALRGSLGQSDRDQWGMGAAVIVPSDATVYARPTQVYVGGAGNVAVTGADGVDVIFTAPPIGQPLPILVTKVKATGTTVGAGLLLAM